MANRMKFCLSATLIAVAASPCVAQSGGRHKELLIQALTASASGSCPPEIMSTMLVDACEQQMPSLGAMLKQRGKIQGATYRGDQVSNAGPAEVYRVQFSQGSMTWMINTGPDGKIVVLWSGSN